MAELDLGVGNSALGHGEIDIDLVQGFACDGGYGCAGVETFETDHHRCWNSCHSLMKANAFDESAVASSDEANPFGHGRRRDHDPHCGYENRA